MFFPRGPAGSIELEGKLYKLSDCIAYGKFTKQPIIKGREPIQATFIQELKSTEHKQNQQAIFLGHAQVSHGPTSNYIWKRPGSLLNAKKSRGLQYIDVGSVLMPHLLT